MMAESLSLVRELSGGKNNKGIQLMQGRQSGMYYVKKYTRNSDQVKTEKFFLGRMRNHPNAMLLASSALQRTVGETSFLTEWCDLGTLDALAKRAGRTGITVEPAFLLKVIEDLCRALCYCHTGRFIPNNDGDIRTQRDCGEPRWAPFSHNDVHLGNVLLQSNSASIFPRIVLGDFGISTLVNPREREGAGKIRRDLHDLALLVRDSTHVGRQPPDKHVGAALALLSSSSDAHHCFNRVIRIQELYAEKYGMPRGLHRDLLPRHPERQPENVLRSDHGGIFKRRAGHSLCPSRPSSRDPPPSSSRGLPLLGIRSSLIPGIRGLQLPAMRREPPSSFHCPLPSSFRGPPPSSFRGLPPSRSPHGRRRSFSGLEHGHRPRVESW